MTPREFNEWGFVEGTKFEGLMPKTMEILGEQYCDGISGKEPVLSVFNPTAQGNEPLEVISPSKIMAK